MTAEHPIPRGSHGQRRAGDGRRLSGGCPLHPSIHGRRSAQRCGVPCSISSSASSSLDAVAMSIFYLAGIAHGPERTRWIFVIAWSIATAIVVVVLLRRVRAVRLANRR